MRSSTRVTPFAPYWRTYVNDPHGLEHSRNYKEQFEREAAIADAHNAHYRVRSNFAVMYAAAALAIDYEILPWRKRQHSGPLKSACGWHWPRWRQGKGTPRRTPSALDAHHLGRTLKELIAKAEMVGVKPKQKVTEEQACSRQKADGFKINGEIYVKPDRFKRWIPTQRERNAFKEQKMILTEREDTATVERKIGGIKGKPRYYAIDVRALRRLASE